MKKYISILLLLFIFTWGYLGEAQSNNIYEKINEKIAWFEKGLSPETDIALIPNNFKEFYARFRMDSIFQKKNIDYDKLLGVIVECDSVVILGRDNWVFEPFGKLKDFGVKKAVNSNEIWNKYFYISTDRILFRYNIEGIGNVLNIGFERINNEWKLTLYEVNAC